MSALEATAVAPRTLIEACFDETCMADLDLVYSVAQAVGLADQPVRLAIRRMEAAGELVQTGRGRRGQLTLSARGRADSARERDYIIFAQAQDEGQVRWDGLWRLFLFSISENKRAGRDALRRALTALGAVALIPGAYLSPHDLREDLAWKLRGLPEHTYIETGELHFPGADSPPSIAATLWPLDQVRAGYEPLAAALDELDAKEAQGPGPVAADVATALQLAELFTLGINSDPLLPPEVLAEDWPPARTRRRFHERWSRLRESGQELQLFRVYAA